MTDYEKERFEKYCVKLEADAQRLGSELATMRDIAQLASKHVFWVNNGSEDDDNGFLLWKDLTFAVKDAIDAGYLPTLE